MAEEAEDKMLTAAAVAALLGVSEGYVRQLRARGGGPPFYELPGRTVYSEKEVRAYLQSRRRH